MHLSAMVCKLNKYLKFTGKWAKSGTSSLALADLAKNVLHKLFCDRQIHGKFDVGYLA